MLIDNKEYISGVCCLAVQVRDYTSEVCAALSIVLPSVRLKDNNIPLMIKNIISTAHEISGPRGK